MSNSDIKYEIIRDQGQYDLCFKIIVIGDSGVGKSCLIIRAIKNYFEDLYAPTVGFEFLSFSIKINEQIIKLQIWDTCGQEVYRSLINSFYRNSSLAILVYSIDNYNSFYRLETWLNDIKTQSNPDIKIILIGNKVDLEVNREVSKELGEKFYNDHKLNFFMETSAKTGFNAQNLLIKAGTMLFEEHLKNKDNISRPGSILTQNVIPELIDQDSEKNNDEKRKSKCTC